MQRGKKGQFYLIASIIIIAVVITLATVTNYAYVKPKPQRFYSLGDVLQVNGMKTIENAEFNSSNVDNSLENYLALFSDYLSKNTRIDFNLVVIYGSAGGGNLTAKVYSRGSAGDVNFNLAGFSTSLSGGDNVDVNTTIIQIDPNSAQGDRINVTLIDGGKEIFVPNLRILEDNNFIFVMTTNDDFNQYIIQNNQYSP